MGERQRRYVEDGERSDAGAARERRFAGERFRREVFELFEATRGLLDRWTVGSYLKEYRDPNRRSSTVVTMDTSLTVGEGLTLLAHAGVLSAPVMDVDALLVSAAARARRAARRKDHVVSRNRHRIDAICGHLI